MEIRVCHFYLRSINPFSFNFFFSSRRRHTRCLSDWSSDVCSSDLRGDLGLGAAVLFGILFLWQLPHTLAIAYLYAGAYARAGVRVLPVVDPNGAMSERQIVSSTLGLVAVSLLPTVIGVSGIAYFVTACTLGLGLLGAGLAHANTPSTASARRVLMASLLYLPLLLAILAFDKT